MDIPTYCEALGGLLYFTLNGIVNYLDILSIMSLITFGIGVLKSKTVIEAKYMKIAVALMIPWFIFRVIRMAWYVPCAVP